MQVAAEVLQLLEHLLTHFLEDLGGHPLANARPSHRQGRQLLSLARRGQASGGGGANPLGRVSHGGSFSRFRIRGYRRLSTGRRAGSGLV